MLTDLHAACRGDLAAFNRLVLAYQDQLYVLCFRALGDESAAMGAAQTAVQQARRHIRQCRDGQFQPWLLGWGVRACRERLRAVPVAGPALAPEASLPASLCQMPAIARLAVILVDVVGLSYRDASLALGLSVEQVGRHLAAARRLLVVYQVDMSPAAG